MTYEVGLAVVATSLSYKAAPSSASPSWFLTMQSAHTGCGVEVTSAQSIPLIPRELLAKLQCNHFRNEVPSVLKKLGAGSSTLDKPA